MCGTTDSAKSLPIVSVIIPAYNADAFIAETLNSVFAQTFTNFEVIVINDGSPDTDALERVITPYRTRIVYLKQDNRGPAAARNAGIARARGRYLAFLDSDDCWLPDYLASQIKIFVDTPSLDVVYCDAFHFGAVGLAGKTFMQTCPSYGPVTLKSLISKECTIITSCSLALKQIVMDAGLFDETTEMRGCEDYDLWLRILYRGGRISYQRNVLGRYRLHPGSLSGDTVKMLKTVMAVYKKTEKTMDLSGETLVVLKNQINKAQAQLDLEAGRSFLVARDFERAKDSLTRANNFFHRTKLKVAILGLKFAPHWTRSAVQAWGRATSSRS